MRSRGKESWSYYVLVILAITVLVPASLANGDDKHQTPSPVEVQNLQPVAQGSVPEYVDTATGIIHQFGDGFGNILSKEAFIERSHQIEAQFHANVNRTLGEARQYLATAKEGEDKKTTQAVIDGIEQAKRDVSSQHAEAVKQAETYQPRQAYEKPRVLVS